MTHPLTKKRNGFVKVGKHLVDMHPLLVHACFFFFIKWYAFFLFYLPPLFVFVVFEFSVF